MGILIIGIGLILGLFLLGLAGQLFRSVRRLDTAIAKFKEEQKELEEQGRSVPPYQALAQLQAEQQDRSNRKKRV